MKVDFTEDELNFLHHVLTSLRDKAIFPYTDRKLEDIRSKVFEAEHKAELKRNNEYPDCDKEGHTWGEQRIADNRILRGCRYCPKIEFRTSFDEEWKDYSEVES